MLGAGNLGDAAAGTLRSAASGVAAASMNADLTNEDTMLAPAVRSQSDVSAASRGTELTVRVAGALPSWQGQDLRGGPGRSCGTPPPRGCDGEGRRQPPLAAPALPTEDEITRVVVFLVAE
jgi:hypothetical protein